MHTYIGPEVGHRNTWIVWLEMKWTKITACLEVVVRWLVHHVSPLPPRSHCNIHTFIEGSQARSPPWLYAKPSVGVQDSLVCTCLYCLVSLFHSVWHHFAIPTTDVWSIPILCHCLAITIPMFAISVLKYFPFVHWYYFHVCPLPHFFLPFSWAIWLGPVFVLSFSEPKEVDVHETAQT